jgi:antitoxin MazE
MRNNPIAISKIAKWGNSLAVRLPKSVAEHQGLKEGDELELIPDVEGLRLKKKPNLDLDVLLDAITDENRHGEIEMGESRGVEQW